MHESLRSKKVATLLTVLSLGGGALAGCGGGKSAEAPISAGTGNIPAAPASSESSQGGETQAPNIDVDFNKNLCRDAAMNSVVAELYPDDPQGCFTNPDFPGEMQWFSKSVKKNGTLEEKLQGEQTVTITLKKSNRSNPLDFHNPAVENKLEKMGFEFKDTKLDGYTCREEIIPSADGELGHSDGNTLIACIVDEKMPKSLVGTAIPGTNIQDAEDIEAAAIQAAAK
jgi:hypothetical protein